MATVGWAFLVAGAAIVTVAGVLIAVSVATGRRLRQWRMTWVRTTGAISKLPYATGPRREVEVTYLGPEGRPYVLVQRRPGELAAPAPRIALPVSVLYAPEDPGAAAVDDHWMGPVARVRGARTAGLLLALLGLLAGLIGAGLLVIGGWRA